MHIWLLTTKWPKRKKKHPKEGAWVLFSYSYTKDQKATLLWTLAWLFQQQQKLNKNLKNPIKEAQVLLIFSLLFAKWSKSSITMNVYLPQTKWPRTKKIWTNVVYNKVTKRNPMPKGEGINLPLLLVIIRTGSKSSIAMNTCLPQTKWQRFFKKPTSRLVNRLPLPSSFVKDIKNVVMSICLPQNDPKKQKNPKERGTIPPLLSSPTKD